MTVQPPAYTVTEAYGAQLRTFDCADLDATLTVTGCAARWIRAQGAKPGAVDPGRFQYGKDDPQRRKGFKPPPVHGLLQRAAGPRHSQQQERAAVLADHAHGLATCSRCPLGALHAGGTHVQRSEHYGAAVCPRCGCGTTRMIGNRVCVSCYNREREVSSGKNARGNKPERLAAIHAIGLRLVVDRSFTPIESRATSTAEVVYQTLRTTKGSITFAPRRRSMAAQMSLFG